ncbi:OLC1v1031587C1 [Oldenlandia corymbosa var. corymbosa]|uniref:OLC1v1031587C1 n=1 Tax=Oldenlandia corymbosa var. corymbosa TaxID=529605 RepID=A0AAV1CIQ8_OLDCO|nr:OLC1v1031587C1 [Oldenlandia corymbosa var. corymbosa]
MSTAIAAVSPSAAPDTTAIEVVVEKPVRKFPPPCWTQEETLALIDAYRERWYALRRGYLRTADWDAVAAAVTSRCPGASPAKTSAQCRHKMEKLRQRYRAEKQRSLTYPVGRFFSSWFFFENMDAMENGTTVSAAGSNQESENLDVSGNESRLKSFLDQNIVKLKLNPKKGSKLPNGISPNFGLGQGVRANHSSKNVEVKVNTDFVPKALNGYNAFLDPGSDKGDEGMGFRGGFGVKSFDEGLVGAPVFKFKNFGNAFANSRNGFDASNEFTMASLGDESSMPPRVRLKRKGRIDGSLSGNISYGVVNNDHDDSKNGLWVPVGTRENYGGNLEYDLRGMNGFQSSSKMGFEKRVAGSDPSSNGNRGRSAIDDMVSAIKMLGEGFIKMENMKMEMAREIEKNRMEMEVKRNEMILESQRQIVDALAKGLVEMKSKKLKKNATVPETQ